MPCRSNANLVRAEQAGEAMRFVEFWRAATGRDPRRLLFDSRCTTCAEPSRLNARGIRFATTRKRGAATVERLRRLPASAWTKAVIDAPKRFHQEIRCIEERVRLSGYEGTVRQVAVEGLGWEKPTLLVANETEETARNLVIRCAGRNRIEDGLGARWTSSAWTGCRARCG